MKQLLVGNGSAELLWLIAFRFIKQSAIQFSATNLLVLRSMTKDYSFAGLRLGFASADSALIEKLSSVRIPWSVNEIVQSAGMAAIKAQQEYCVM